MTVIKASCPECGECQLSPPDIDLQVSEVRTMSYYTFLCPSCCDTVKKPADDHIIRLLLSGGVLAHLIKVPQEALEIHVGPQLDYDDLLAFCVDLMDNDCLTSLL